MHIATPVYRGEPSKPTKRTGEAIKAIHGGIWRVLEGHPWVGNARSELAGEFLESRQSHILWLDADISFHPSVVELLLRANASIITCAYRKRKPPHEYTSRTLDGREHCFAPERRLSNGGRVIEIESDGLGCCLMRREVLEFMSRRYQNPWLGPKLGYVSEAGKPRVHLFAHDVATIDGVRRIIGEDGAFFMRARACGFKVECLADATIWHDGIKGRLGEEL